MKGAYLGSEGLYCPCTFTHQCWVQAPRWTYMWGAWEGAWSLVTALDLHSHLPAEPSDHYGCWPGLGSYVPPFCFSFSSRDPQSLDPPEVSNAKLQYAGWGPKGQQLVSNMGLLATCSLGVGFTHLGPAPGHVNRTEMECVRTLYVWGSREAPSLGWA